jgi:hypothetical protein
MSKDKSTPVAAKRALASEAATGKRGRFSASRKAEAVLRLLRGEEPGITQSGTGCGSLHSIIMARAVPRGGPVISQRQDWQN